MTKHLTGNRWRPDEMKPEVVQGEEKREELWGGTEVSGEEWREDERKVKLPGLRERNRKRVRERAFERDKIDKHPRPPCIISKINLISLQSASGLCCLSLTWSSTAVSRCALPWAHGCFALRLLTWTVGASETRLISCCLLLTLCRENNVVRLPEIANLQQRWKWKARRSSVECFL